MKIMEVSTKIDSPNAKAGSLRAIIPKEIVRFLDINRGDRLKWVVEAEDSSFKISVKKEE